jgi:hypothetical protein
MTVLNKTEVLALRGLRLPPVVLKEIQRAGIYCQPAISIEYQRHAQRYLIRGVESGGAVSRLGLYCAFIDERGAPLTTVQPVSSVGVNGIHAAVLSPAFIRVQIVRSGRHYELLLTHHGLVSTEGKTRPSLSSSVLFHGQHGRLELELWGKDSCLRGTFGPFFL